MSETTAIALCQLDDLEDGGVRRFELGDRALAVVRIGDSVYALNDNCSHRNVPLSSGTVDVDECALECMYHGAAFDLETGEPSALPATRRVPVYEVVVADGEVSVVLS